MNLHPFTLVLTKPFTSSLGTFSERKGVLVSVVYNGHTGWGEASPLPGLSQESLGDVTEELSSLCRSKPSLPKVLEDVGPWTEQHCSTASGQHAVASAILDAMGTANNTPIAALLTENVRKQIPISYLYSGDDIQLQAATNAGARVVKVKVGIDSLDADLRRIRHIRSVIDSDVAIRVDANGAWSEEQAVKAIEHMAPIGVHSMEEPIGNGDLEAMARLRGNGIQIALDESVRSISELEQIIAAGAADAIVIKPMLIGTPMRAMKMMRTAADANLGMWVTTTIDGAVGRMMAIHLAAAAPTTRLEPCGLNTASWIREDLGQTPDMHGAHLDTPKAAGLGIRVSI